MAYHHGDLRNALIEAATALLDEDGPAGLTLRAAARRAGVSSAAPYRHFADRASLLAAVAVQGFELLAAEMETGLAEMTGASGAADDKFWVVERLGRLYIEHARRFPERFRLMFGHELGDRDGHEHLKEAAGQAFFMLRGAVAEAVGAQDVDVATDVCWACVHGIATLAVDGQLDETRSDETQRMLSRALRAAWA